MITQTTAKTPIIKAPFSQETKEMLDKIICIILVVSDFKNTILLLFIHMIFIIRERIILKTYS